MPLDDQHDLISNGEGGIGVVERVGAHAYRSIRQVAEHASGVFAGNDCLTAGTDGVAQVGTVEGVRVGFFHGDQQRSCVFVITLDDAVQFVARVIFSPQVGNGGISHFSLGQGLYQNRSTPPDSGGGRLPERGT